MTANMTRFCNECLHAECCNTEFHILFIAMQNVVMLSVINKRLVNDSQHDKILH
jgi:hypothetical protein